ncbi:V-type ATP synthase subunit E [Clostridium amazonitimonense]|uniref:V-type ATP synthase subunit E n=1 Tax=Clostridium amazonitimonense TaxID=1499689 RepID=UPI000509AC69|nr:V-type ATP synthase subunit E family protein [Clostridium amazonitimonense]
MTTIEDKINLFSKILYDRLNEEKEEKLNKFNEEAEIKLKYEKEKIEELKKNTQREVLKKANIKANEIVAKEKLNKQRDILALKDKIIKDTISEVKEKLLDFVNSKEYDDYFMNILKKSLNEVDHGKYYVILLDRDIKRYESYIKEVIESNSHGTIEVKISNEDFIGGLIIRDFEGRFKVDNSLCWKLEESKEIIGVKIMEMLA